MSRRMCRHLPPAANRPSRGKFPLRRKSSVISKFGSPRPSERPGRRGGRAIKTLFSAETITSRVDQLASDIAATRLEDLVMVAVLKGSFIFAADLVRALHRHGLRPEIDFIFSRAMTASAPVAAAR